MGPRPFFLPVGVLGEGPGAARVRAAGVGAPKGASGSAVAPVNGGGKKGSPPSSAPSPGKKPPGGKYTGAVKARCGAPPRAPGADTNPWTGAPPSSARPESAGVAAVKASPGYPSGAKYAPPGPYHTIRPPRGTPAGRAATYGFPPRAGTSAPLDARRRGVRGG